MTRRIRSTPEPTCPMCDEICKGRVCPACGVGIAWGAEWARMRRPPKNWERHGYVRPADGEDVDGLGGYQDAAKCARERE